MKIKQLGNSDLKISEIGLGTWAIGGGDWVWVGGIKVKKILFYQFWKDWKPESIGLILLMLMVLEWRKLLLVKL